MPAHSENLSAYLDGELTAAEIAELEAEFLADPQVRAERDELERVMDFVRANGPLQAPSGFAEAVLARAAKEASPASGGALIWLRRPMGIPLEALAVAAAAMFVLVFALQGKSGSDVQVTSATREVFDPDAPPMAAAAPPEQAEAEEPADGVAMVAPAPLPDPVSRPRPKPKARPRSAPKAEPAPEATSGIGSTVLGSGEVEAIQQLGTKGYGSGAEGYGAKSGAADAEPAVGDVPLSAVPYNYTLHSSSADVLKQLDRVARRHGGQLLTESGEVYRPSEMSPGTSRIIVSIPNTQMSAFTADLRSLGQVITTAANSFFPGDTVQIQIDVDYQVGARYAPSAATEK